MFSIQFTGGGKKVEVRSQKWSREGEFDILRER